MDMNWDSQLNSILSAADGSVASMRERLSSAGKLSKGAEVKERGLGSDLGPPAPSHTAQILHTPPSSLHSDVQWADLAAIQSQLQIQSQLTESLTQRLHDLEREKQSQQSHIQTLQEEVQSLAEKLRVKNHERKDLISEVEQRMEQWRREIGRELSSLRGNMTEAASHGHLEESWSSRLQRDEVDLLRIDLDTLKTQLTETEADMRLQQMEAEETRRQYERSCQMLEDLTGSYRTHSSYLLKTLRNFHEIQNKFYQMRTTLSDLQKEVKSLNPRGHGSQLLVSELRLEDLPFLAPSSRSRRVRGHEEDSDSESSSPTPSLAEISSDDLFWLEEEDPAPHRRTPPSVTSTPSDLAAPEDDANDLLDDEDDNPASESDLGLKDL